MVLRSAPSIFALCLVALPSAAGAQSEDAFRETLDMGAAVALSFMIGTLAMKITAIVIGYLIVKLGHDTLIRGITGDLNFGFTGGGVKAKLKSASPGAAFVLAGAAIIIWALAVQKPFALSIPQPGAVEAASPKKLPAGPSLPK